MIFIGIGSNLPSAKFGLPLELCEAAVGKISQAAINVLQRSSWYETAPVPVSAQGNYINGVIAVATKLSSQELLATLLAIESEMGRVRTLPNAARIIDLDLIAYHDEISASETLNLPHPRLSERAFVAQPIAEIAPHWHHPRSGHSITTILDALSNQADQEIKLIST